MMFEQPSTYWILGSYFLGTFVGWFIANSMARSVVENAVGLLIDTLIENGYLKSRTSEDGEIELVKFNDEV